MRRVTVVGASGLLGTQLVKVLAARGHQARALTHADLDITDVDSVARALHDPGDAVVNAAAWTDVDGCARDPDRAMRINGHGAANIADAARSAGALIVQISTNEVFDGRLERPYREDDLPRPINPYGSSKRFGEEAVARNPRHMIVRTAWLFTADRGFPTRIAAAAERAAASSQPLRVVNDEVGNPTPVDQLAEAMVVLLERQEGDGVPWQVIHLAGQPPVSRYEWAVDVLGRTHGRVAIVPIRSDEFPRPSRVPQRAILDTRLATSLGLPSIDWRSA